MDKQVKKQYFTLPNGKHCGLGVYVSAWRTLKQVKPTEQIRGWDHFDSVAGDILRDIRSGLHDRINRHIPNYGNGRKWASDWFWTMYRASRDLNTPRLAIHWLPSEIKHRFSDRLKSSEI